MYIQIYFQWYKVMHIYIDMFVSLLICLFFGGFTYSPSLEKAFRGAVELYIVHWDLQEGFLIVVLPVHPPILCSIASYNWSRFMVHVKNVTMTVLGWLGLCKTFTCANMFIECAMSVPIDWMFFNYFCSLISTMGFITIVEIIICFVLNNHQPNLSFGFCCTTTFAALVVPSVCFVRLQQQHEATHTADADEES